MDEITAFILTFVFGFVVIVPPMVILALRNKLPLPIHKKYRLQIYSLPDGMEPDLSSNASLRAQLSQIENPIRKEFQFWRVKEKGVLKYFVRTRLIMGFNLDYAYSSCLRNIDGQSTLRLYEKKRDVWHPDNFIALDLPDNLDKTRVEMDLSKAGDESNQALDLEQARPKNNNFLIEFILPLAIMMVFIILLFLFYMHTENMTKINNDGLISQSNALKASIDKNYFANCLLLKQQYHIDCEAELERLKSENQTKGTPLTIVK